MNSLVKKKSPRKWNKRGGKLKKKIEPEIIIIIIIDE